MRTRLWLFLFIISPLFGSTSYAARTAVIRAPVHIPLGQTRNFALGEIPAAGTVLLKIGSRLDSTGLGGSMMFMQLRLSGREIEPAVSRTAVRMVNKPMSSPVSAGVSGDWYSKKLGGWRVLYAPDFKGALRQTFYADNPYEIVLDVTDLVNAKTDNTLEITNTARESTRKYTGTAADLVIGELSVETSPAPSPMTQAAQAVLPVVNRGEPAAGAAVYHGELLPGGGFALRMGQRTFRFNSAFSYPHAGFHHLFAGTANPDSRKSWRVEVDAKTNRVIAQCDDYRVERTVKFEKTRVEIADAVTNLHQDAPLGMAVRHEMELGGLGSPQIRLAGNPDPTVNEYYAPGNPSVHVRLPDSGIGLIVEDDVFRNQARLYVTPARQNAPAVAGIHTEMLRLAPGETYALRWAVYPVAGPDYYDFINLVRTDWGANFTVPGAWWWGFLPDAVLQMPVPELRDLLVQNGIRYANFDGGWIDRLHKEPRLGFGVGVFDDYWESYRGRIRDAAEKLRQALPGIKVLGYYDVQQDSSENSAQKFADSLLTNVHGEPGSGEWAFPGHAPTRFYSTVPTLENSFGRAALSVAERYLDDLKLDGLYWDEMDNNTYGRPRITYNNFDGHSCQLDPKTWTMLREIGIAPLSSAAFRQAVIHSIQKRGGTILGNTPTGNLADLHSGIFRMVEIQNNDTNHFQGNLETPLGYIGTHNQWPDILRALHFATLPVLIMPRDRTGAYVNLDSDILPYLFPFTPLELHAGYLLGKERIIVTHDGHYGWQSDSSLAVTRHFDEKGKLTEKHFATQLTPEGARTGVTLGNNEAAVLEKIPVGFVPAEGVLPADWKAEITVIAYTQNRVQLGVDAPSGVTITMRDGAFRVQESRPLNVTLQPRQSMASEKYKIVPQSDGGTMTLPAGFDGTLIIQ